MFSETEKAALVRKQVIDTFMAYRRGLLVPAQQAPAIPDFSNPAAAARAWADQFEQRQLAEETVRAITQEVTMQVWAGFHHIHLNQSQTSKRSWAMRRLYSARGLNHIRKELTKVALYDGRVVDRPVKVYQRALLDETARALGIIA